ncbi:MAG: hypothetical protein FJZ00_08480, partial [Candidatus Sericytochromatia bacterium]|nr:hypothetical protein [Candidatus Tanganyikabacteria bacterium]
MTLAPVAEDLPVQEIALPFKAVLRMRSDWHIGSGAGRPGDVDRLVKRDVDGLPYVPAKTLTGIWRDACERVADGLDGEIPGVAHRWVAFLFGRSESRGSVPRPATLTVRAARFPDIIREALFERPELQAALTFVKPGVAIDPESGRALDTCLRFEEMARAGSVLEADCSLQMPGDQDQVMVAKALLLAGATLVRRLGAKRRRGAGRCDLDLQRLEFPDWLAWLEALDPLPEPPQTRGVAGPGVDLSVTRAGGDWQVAKLEIETLGPVIVPGKTIGNVVKSLDFIPGTYFLPLLMKKLNGTVDTRLALAHGDLVVTNATPVVADEKGRPVPFALFHEKLGGGLHKGQGVLNRLCERGGAFHNRAVKAHRRGFVSSSSATALPDFSSLALGIDTHNTIADEVQRPTGDVGGVYSYEFIPTGTRLRTEVRVRQELVGSKASAWWAELSGEYRIGRAKKDDYGRVRVTASRGDHPAEAQAMSQITVWLLSDLLIRDDRLRPTANPGALAKALQDALGVSLAVREAPSGTATMFARTSRLDSWQVAWGLPRPTLSGLAAGSCFVFDVQGTIAPERLRSVAASGLGERTAEGYGQVAFNDPLLQRPLASLQRAIAEPGASPKRAGEPIAANSPYFDIARQIETEAWREAIRRAALRVAASGASRNEALGLESYGSQSRPSLSQLGGFRGAIVGLASEADRGDVLGWLDRIDQNEKRRKA